VKTLDEMLSRSLLTSSQHAEISAWIAQAKTPEAIMQMPQTLWRSLALASALMNIDADFTQPPLLSAG
jgi:hypothetical protein